MKSLMIALLFGTSMAYASPNAFEPTPLAQESEEEQEQEKQQEQEREQEQEQQSFSLEGDWRHTASICSDGSPSALDYGETLVSMADNRLTLAMDLSPTCSAVIEGNYRAMAPFLYSTATNTEYMGKGCSAFQAEDDSDNEQVMIYSFDGPDTLLTTTYTSEAMSNSCPVGTYRTDYMTRL